VNYAVGFSGPVTTPPPARVRHGCRSRPHLPVRSFARYKASQTASPGSTTISDPFFYDRAKMTPHINSADRPSATGLQLRVKTTPTHNFMYRSARDNTEWLNFAKVAGGATRVDSRTRSQTRIFIFLRRVLSGNHNTDILAVCDGSRSLKMGLHEAAVSRIAANVRALYNRMYLCTCDYRNCCCRCCRENPQKVDLLL